MTRRQKRQELETERTADHDVEQNQPVLEVAPRLEGIQRKRDPGHAWRDQIEAQVRRQLRPGYSGSQPPASYLSGYTADQVQDDEPQHHRRDLPARARHEQ